MSKLQEKYSVINTLSISEGETGVNYQDLFCNHLVGATKIEIREPYLRNHHQFGNLIKFIDLLKDQEGDIQVDLITSQSTGRFARDYIPGQQLESLRSLALYMKDKGIVFNYEFDNSSHVRRITANNENTIKSDRGLHIYRESVAYNGSDDFSQRQCKPTEIDYIRPLEIELTQAILNDDIGEQREFDEADMVREAEYSKGSIIIDNITAKDALKKKIRVLQRNKYLFPQEIPGERKSYILPIEYQKKKYDLNYTIGSPVGHHRSGVISLGAELYDYIGIEEGTTLSIELRDDGVYVISKLVGGENNHG